MDDDDELGNGFACYDEARRAPAVSTQPNRARAALRILGAAVVGGVLMGCQGAIGNTHRISEVGLETLVRDVFVLDRTENPELSPVTLERDVAGPAIRDRECRGKRPLKGQGNFFAGADNRSPKLPRNLAEVWLAGRSIAIYWVGAPFQHQIHPNDHGRGSAVVLENYAAFQIGSFLRSPTVDPASEIFGHAKEEIRALASASTFCDRSGERDLAAHDAKLDSKQVDLKASGDQSKDSDKGWSLPKPNDRGVLLFFSFMFFQLCFSGLGIRLEVNRRLTDKWWVRALSFQFPLVFIELAFGFLYVTLTMT